MYFTGFPMLSYLTSIFKNENEDRSYNCSQGNTIMLMFACVHLPQASTCPRSSGATVATWTKSPSPTDRCLSTLSESRKGTLSYFCAAQLLTGCVPSEQLWRSRACVGWIQVCLLFHRQTERSRWHWKTQKWQKTESRFRLAGAAADRCPSRETARRCRSVWDGSPFLSLSELRAPCEPWR